MHLRKNYAAIFMTLLYAFTTRSVLGEILFRFQIQLLLFYGITYLLLLLCLMNAFEFWDKHIYAPNGFYSIFILFFIIAFELIAVNDFYSMLYYGLALLIPFAVPLEIKKTTLISKIFTGGGVFFALGCFINWLFPAIFQTAIYPIFTQSAQKSLQEVAEFSDGVTYYAGFTSQVGYTSFFIAIGVGGLFCFRNIDFQRSFFPIISILIMGLLLTGKRGPVVFLIITLGIIYFFEGYGREKIERIIKIAFVFVVAYIALMILADVSGLSGIERIFEAVQTLVMSGSVEDIGRNQLHEQAMEYFVQNPILGIGWGNFKNLFTLRGTHVHCIYLQLLCETGVVGFVIFVSFFLTRLLSTLKLLAETQGEENNRENCWIKFSLFIQIYFLLYGITGNPLYDIEETIFYFFAVGVSYLPLLSDWEEELRGYTE